MTVNLTPDLEQLVETKMETGRYQSASEVVGDALRLLEERDSLFESWRGDIKRKIAEGAASFQSGEGVDGESVFDRIEAELDAIDTHIAG